MCCDLAWRPGEVNSVSSTDDEEDEDDRDNDKDWDWVVSGDEFAPQPASPGLQQPGVGERDWGGGGG